jgi:parallel beta-helix repeat protein
MYLYKKLALVLGLASLSAVPISFVAFLLAPIAGMTQPPEKTIAWYCSHAPFPMPVINSPQIPDRSFTITDYGAVGDGQTLNTAALEKTIQTCATAGGGRVIVPQGLWLTGPIELQSHVELHLERGALILFTRDHTHFPLIHTPGSQKMSVASPIYGFDLQDIAITGEGVMDGGGDSWRPVKKSKTTAQQWKGLLAQGGVLSLDGEIWWPSQEAMNHDIRPYMLYLVNCRNVLLKDLTIRNSPKFVFYPNSCTDLVMDHVNIFNEWWAQNGDGIDISASRNVILYRCTVSAGDDGICMKSSSGNKHDGSGGPALENVIVAGCTVYHAHGGFVIGSNTDGGMHNISVRDCSFIGTDVGLRFKSNMGRGGLVSDIFISDIVMRDIATNAILFDTYYEDAPAGSVKDPNKPKPTDKTPEFRDFHISRVYCSGAQTAISITGLAQMPVHGIAFDSVTISSQRGLVATQARDIDLHAVRLITVQQPAIEADKTAELRIH